MATVRQHLESMIPHTHRALVDVSKMDGDTLPDAVGIQTDVVVQKLFVADTDVESLGEAVKDYVAALVARRVISAGIEHWGVKTRLSDSMGAPPGVQGIGGEQSQNYDRVQMLMDLDEMLAKRIAEDRADFLALAGPVLRTQPSTGSGARLTASTSEFKTPGPDAIDALQIPRARYDTGF